MSPVFFKKRSTAHCPPFSLCLNAYAASRSSFFSLVKGLKLISCTEKKRDAPHSRQSNQRVYYAADQGILSTANPGNYVKLEKPYASPVERAYDGEDERYSIHYHLSASFPGASPDRDKVAARPFLWRKIFR